MTFIDKLLGKKSATAEESKPISNAYIDAVAKRVYDLILPQLLTSVREHIEKNTNKVVRVPPKTFSDIKNDE